MRKLKLTGIFARTVNGVIGSGNRLPWPHSIKADLQFFKDKTMNYPVIMGRNTWESLPKKPLGGRMNIIISRSLCKFEMNKKSENVVYFSTFFDAFDWLESSGYDRAFVIGGARLFDEISRYINEWYVTVVPYVNIIENPVRYDVKWLSSGDGVVKVDEQFVYLDEPVDGINWLVFEHYSIKPGYVCRMKNSIVTKLTNLWNRICKNI